MARSKIRIRKGASTTKAQIYFSREPAVKRDDDSSFLLDWVSGDVPPLARSPRYIRIGGQELGVLDRRRWARE